MERIATFRNIFIGQVRDDLDLLAANKSWLINVDDAGFCDREIVLDLDLDNEFAGVLHQFDAAHLAYHQTADGDRRRHGQPFYVVIMHVKSFVIGEQVAAFQEAITPNE